MQLGAACWIDLFSADRVTELGVPLGGHQHNSPCYDQMYFVAPPQDSTVVPVMYEFFSDTRNAASQPISSGLPRRLSIAIPESAARTSSTVLPRAFAIRSARGPQLSTAIVPGQRLLTNMLNGARSFAMSLLNPMMAALDSVVDSAPGKSIVPDMPEIFSTRPAFDFLRCGMANFVVWIYDIRLRS